MYATVTVPSPPVAGPTDLTPTSGRRVLSDGRTIVRVAARCTAERCEGMIVTITDPDGFPVVPPRPCPACWFRRAFERLVEYGQIRPSYGQAYRDELDRFAAAWPRVHARLAHLLAPLPPGPLPEGVRFLPGEVRVEHALVRDADSLLVRHCRGDFGTFGRHPGRIDDDERWGPQLHGVAVCNAVAIESGSGVVLSRFARRFEPGHWIDLATWLRPGREAETVIVAGEGHHPMVPV